MNGARLVVSPGGSTIAVCRDILKTPRFHVSTTILWCLLLPAILKVREEMTHVSLKKGRGREPGACGPAGGYLRRGARAQRFLRQVRAFVSHASAHGLDSF